MSEKKKPNDKYKKRLPKRVLDEGVLDVYDVIVAYQVTCPARQNAIKKLLCSGQRGHKDTLTDLEEAAVNIDRAILLVKDTIPVEDTAVVPERHQQCNICGNPDCSEPNQTH